jgi:DNA-binding SARP family transcriptional activator/tetratricopeptide (TPR) repeat protein
LAEGVRAAGPAIVSVIAPAGYGKSTFTRELLDGYPARAVCDCRGISSAADLVRRVVPALCDEDPGRTAVLAQVELALSETRPSPETLGVVLAAWRRPAPAAAFVFDDADEAAALPDGRDVLAKLLAERPEGRVVVLCSREPLRLHLARFAPPHRILTVRAADLAFAPGEMRALLASAGVPDATAERAIAITGGWPIAALLLARFAQEGRLEAMLDRLDDVAFDELYDYIAEDVLGSALPATIDGLLAATIPNATERDVRLALGDGAAFDAFVAFARTSPFVGRDDDGAFTLAPLAASTLRARHAERRGQLLASAAAAYEEAAEFQRAAEIHLARGDAHAAADALEQIETFEGEAPLLAYARTLGALDREIVLQHPRLWSVGALARMFTVDPRSILDELEAAAARSPARWSPLRVWLDVFRIVALAQLGELEAALAHVEEFRRRIAAPDVPATRIHAWLQCQRGVVCAALGRTAEAERDIAAARSLVGSVPMLTGGSLVALGADVARVHGDRAAERERLERAIAVHAQRGGLRNFAGFYHAEAAFGAWLAGDDAELARHGFALDDAVEREGIRGVAFFTAAVQGRPAQPGPADLPKLVAAGRLVAAAAAPDETSALRHAEAAREVAAAAGTPFMQVLAALALAELAPARAAERHAEAAAHARRIDASELHAAVDALARGEHGGFLEPFARRFRYGAGAARARPSLVIELVAGRVLRDGAPLALAEREHALLTAIALRPEAVTRERLADMLWPDLGERAARNAFHVCLHRAKARLATGDAIAHTSDGYRLGAGVRVDLWEIEHNLAGARPGGGDDDATAAALRDAYEQLRAERPAKFEAWEWFEPTERRLRELRDEVAQRLANHALAAGRHDEALALAHETIAYDPCDEPAREIAIRAHLAAGDRAAALRHYRQYRDVLQTELQCEPSESIARLVGAHA